jgi:hypothetical protein
MPRTLRKHAVIIAASTLLAGSSDVFGHGMGKIKDNEWLTPGITFAGSSDGPVFGLDVGLVHNAGEKPDDLLPWTFFGGWLNYARVMNTGTDFEDRDYKRASGGLQLGAQIFRKLPSVGFGIELGVSRNIDHPDAESNPLAGVFVSVGFISGYIRSNMESREGQRFREIGIMIKYPVPLRSWKQASQY